MIEFQHDHEHMATLLELMVATNTATDAQTIATQALDCLIAREQIVAGGIWMDQSGDLVGLARRDLDPEAARPEIRRVLAAPAIEPQTTVYRRESRLTILPLTRLGGPIGALAAVTYSPPDPGTLLLLRAVAAHLAGALVRAQPGERDEGTDRAWEEFLSHAAHEIKNPLASIKGYADLLLRRAAKDPADPHTKGLNIISQQVGRTTALLDQLSDIARIGAGRLSVDRHVGDIGALVDRVIRQYQASEHQHTIAFESDDTPLPCRFDEQRIGQVVGAVVGNALKFSSDGSAIDVALRRVTADDGAPMVQLSVGDTGVGVPEGEQERVFERFFRGSNVRDTYAGMGVGLYIARAILDLHDGRIWLERAPEQGTTSFVTLPLL
jgi:signal transduction histidine kinase